MSSTAYSTHPRLAPTPTSISPSKSPVSLHRQSPSPSRSPTARSSTTGPTRASKASLHLSTLPRFHPATFQPHHPDRFNSRNTTPSATANSPHALSPPRSPRSPYPSAQTQAQAQPRPMSPLSQFHSNHHSHLFYQQHPHHHHHHHHQQQQQQVEAQRQLHLYQRELLAAGGRAAVRSPRQRPASPQLIPLGSPGPVTPLALEDEQHQYHNQQQHGDYLVAGTTAALAATDCQGLVKPTRGGRGYGSGTPGGNGGAGG